MTTLRRYGSPYNWMPAAIGQMDKSPHVIVQDLTLEGDGEGMAGVFLSAADKIAIAERLPDLPPVSADYAEEIAKYQVWVAEIGNDIVGDLVLVPQDGFMLLANVAVRPDRKGTGLGRAFMARAEAEAGARVSRAAPHDPRGCASRPTWICRRIRSFTSTSDGNRLAEAETKSR